jgi:signal transduction histidine kinase
VRISIRSKLAAALAVPMVALAGVAALEVANASARADEATREAEFATAAVGPGSLISRLQDERNFSLIALLGMTDSLALPVTSYDQARGATDAAKADLEAFVTSRGGDVAAAFEEGLGAVERELGQLREEIDAQPTPAPLEFSQGVYSRFALLIRVLINDSSNIALQVDDADMRTGVELITLATRDLENSAEISRGIFDPLLTGQPTDSARLVVAEHLSRYLVGRDRMLDRSVGPYSRLPENYLLTAQNRDQIALYQQFVNTGEADIDQLTAALGSTEDPPVTQMRDAAAEVLNSVAGEIVNDADQQRQLALVVGVTLVAAALFVTLSASRSITGPLRSLTKQAETMAETTLPAAVQEVLDTPLGDDVIVPRIDPITVKTRDEVADVAVALNTVQTSALDLAVEQAVLRRNIADSFVNLGRRNQNLLDRQLDHITDLERQEQEPERLEDLFRLDHLATRMRRNAESLLRLAGGGDATSTSWTGPVPIVDVIRGALGEVENYQRVDVRGIEPASVTSSAGADLAHAVAELIENALSFSPPGEVVQVRGRKADGGYILAIVDQGVGMSEEQLEVANRRLAGEESFTVAPSRYLGHYVAGHLAKTHGITIKLEPSPVGGLTAGISIPASLIVSDAPTRPARPGIEAEHDGAPAPAASAPIEPAAPPAAAAPSPAPAAAPRPAGAATALAEPPAARPAPKRIVPPTPAPAALTPPDRTPAPTSAPTGAPAPAPLTPTPGGLTRRVRGANAPTATNVAAAFGGADPTPAAPAPTTADDVASFLSAFSGGVERGLAETTHPDEEEQ